MLRKSFVSLVLGGSLVSIPVAAQEPAAENAAETPPATAQPAVPPPAAAPAEAKSEVGQPGGWRTEISGYFRAPMSLGISSRQSPDSLDLTTGKLTGPSKTQIAYGPNRVVDWNYYSFAYTRLQEQDWAEFFIHAKKKHVDAAVGWMGYWFSGVGFRNYDAGWAPGLAYVALDSDFQAANLNPSVTLTAGAWWPKFGYFEKYDTYTLGRFRQMGEQLRLEVPLNPDLTVVLTEGFGTNRDGSFNVGAPPFYGSQTAIDLLTYWNAQIKFNNVLDASIHYNTMWTADPNKFTQSMATGNDKSFTTAEQAHLTVLGAEAHVRLPRLGHAWISPSFISVRNGWALDNGGTEVMHSLGGAGIAGNYLGYNFNTDVDTGSGSMFNLGFLYENSLANIQGQAPGTLPDVMFSVFGLLADSNLNLPTPPPNTTNIPASNIKQFKWGADATVQPLTWLGVMLRFDYVNYDLEAPGFVFLSVTPRIIVSSHFLSTERIYLQYSRYKYGDKMTLGGNWPWQSPLVPGSSVIQQGAYQGAVPDENVVKLQADIAF